MNVRPAAEMVRFQYHSRYRGVRGGGRKYQNGGPLFANLSPRLSLFSDHLRTVLAVKGSLRRAQQRRALDGLRAVPDNTSEMRERLTPNGSLGRGPLRRHFGTLFLRHRHENGQVVAPNYPDANGKYPPINNHGFIASYFGEANQSGVTPDSADLERIMRC